MLLLWKGISFEKKDEKLRDWTPEFTALFSDKKPSVPVLIDDGNVVFESLDIMEYIESKESSLDMTHFRKWGDWSAKDLRDAIQMYKYGEGGSQEEGSLILQKLFDQLENELEPYLNGEFVSMADFAVWPFIRQALRVQPSKVNMGPKLSNWFTKIENKEELKDLMKKD